MRRLLDHSNSTEEGRNSANALTFRRTLELYTCSPLSFRRGAGGEVKTTMPKLPESKSVEALRHDEERRKNIPTAEYQSILQHEQQTPIQVAYERRNCDLDPQLVWRGKD